jgi:pilus assembly protein CpaB
MRSRALIIVLALLLGGAAAIFAAQYLNSARSQIQSAARPIEVLVAQQDIPRGTRAEDLFQKKLVAREKVPQQFVASGAISSARAIEGQVLAVALSAGEQLTSGRFQFPSQAGLAYNVPADYVAVSIAVDDVSGVSGFVHPGDNVALMATVEKPAGKGATVGAQAVPETLTKTLIPKARVLAVGESVGVEQTQEQKQSSSGFGSTTASGGTQGAKQTVTLALSMENAERAVFVANEGAAGTRSLWLALLPVQSTGARATRGQTLDTVLK